MRARTSLLLVPSLALLAWATWRAGAPARLPSYAALVGDRADDLPGVPGVGPRTAARWVREHGDLRTLLAHVDALEPARLRPAVAGRRAELLRNEELARLRADVPLGSGPRHAPVTRESLERLGHLFGELEFRSLVPRLDALHGTDRSGANR